jgi:hypothetical protein
MPGRGGEDMLLQKIPVPYPPTEDQIAQARLVVCANCFDSIEAETMLAMLGLL